MLRVNGRTGCAHLDQSAGGERNRRGKIVNWSSRKGVGWRAVAFAGPLAMLFAGVPGLLPAVEAVRAQTAARVVASASAGEVLREIDDPATGDLWLLVRDPARPAGPGRLLLVRHGARLKAGAGGKVLTPARVVAQPIVRAGGQVLVEEHTPVVEARLEAVALEPAVQGATFRARLTIGGAVVRVTAVSPGHAVLGAMSEVEP